MVKAVSYFASGTGAAGLVGALLWWEVRSLGVRTGVGISAVSSVGLSIQNQPLILDILLLDTAFHHASDVSVPPPAL